MDKRTDLDKAHIETLFVAQVPNLRRYARALTRNPEQADDLVQTCLERAWSRRHRWKADSDLRAWLFTIMHNLYVNLVKRSSRSPEVALFEEVDLMDARTPGQELAIQLKDLESGLAELPFEQRETLVLVCVEEMTYEQVSEVLGVPVGTVMSRLHRARERMRHFMHSDRQRPLRSVK